MVVRGHPGYIPGFPIWIRPWACGYDHRHHQQASKRSVRSPTSRAQLQEHSRDTRAEGTGDTAGCLLVLILGLEARTRIVVGLLTPSLIDLIILWKRKSAEKINDDS